MNPIFAVLAILLAACQTPPAMNPATSDLPRISVTSDGGMTGRGVGGIEIDGGRIAATLGQKSCGGTLSEDERAELQKLIGFQEVKSAGHGAPDQIHYTLTAGGRSASWYGEETPKEIGALFRSLWKIRARVLAAC
jgi:hypothetical protein